MCWRKAWLYRSANNITVECCSILRYSYICQLTDVGTRVQLFSWHSWHFPPDFSSVLSDSAGSVSLHNIFWWRKLPRCARLPTGALDTETFHWSCRQLWLHSIWLRHQELHRQENSWIRDASSSHKGRRIHIFEHLYWTKNPTFHWVFLGKFWNLVGIFDLLEIHWKHSNRMDFILDFPEIKYFSHPLTWFEFFFSKCTSSRLTITCASCVTKVIWHLNASYTEWAHREMIYTVWITFLCVFFLWQIIQKFHISVSPLTGDVKAKTHGLLCPGAPIHLRFIEREK